MKLNKSQQIIKTVTTFQDPWTYFDTSFTVHFFQVFRDFLVFYPGCACAVFLSSSQYREKYRDTACFSKHNFGTFK